MLWRWLGLGVGGAGGHSLGHIHLALLPPPDGDEDEEEEESAAATSSSLPRAVMLGGLSGAHDGKPVVGLSKLMEEEEDEGGAWLRLVSADAEGLLAGWRIQLQDDEEDDGGGISSIRGDGHPSPLVVPACLPIYLSDSAPLVCGAAACQQRFSCSACRPPPPVRAWTCACRPPPPCRCWWRRAGARCCTWWTWPRPHHRPARADSTWTSSHCSSSSSRSRGEGAGCW